MLNLRSSLFALWAAMSALACDAAPIVNEMMASNQTVVASPLGQFDDWVEIHNPDASDLDLRGYYLSDDPEDPTKWQITGENPVIVPAGGYTLLWLDDHASAGPTHLPFRLNAGGDVLILTAPDGVTELENITLPPQHPDISFGRTVGGGETFRYLINPTPGAANDPLGVAILDGVSFSEEAGTFVSPITLSLTTATTEATIRYTLDGSLPTGTNGQNFTAPLVIVRSTCIRAALFLGTQIISPVESRTFLALNPSLASFDSNLPIILLDSQGYDFSNDSDPRTDYPIQGVCAGIFEGLDGARTTVTGLPHFIGRAGMNVRGASSKEWPKKQFKFETWDENDNDRDVPLLGMPADSDWILQAPYFDKTLMRNHFVYHWWEQLGYYSPRSRFVEVFLNPNANEAFSMAHYRGVYLLMEKIKRSPNRMDLARLDEGMVTEPEITGGYLAQATNINENWVSTQSTRYKYVEPSEAEGFIAQKTWLRNYVQAAENSVFAANFSDPQNGYAKYLDVPSQVDYDIMRELSRNGDGASTFFSIDRGGKLKMGPLWDYNQSLGLSSLGSASLGYSYETFGANRYYMNANHWLSWWDKLDDDPNYQRVWNDRWVSLRESTLTTANLLDQIDSVATLLDEAQARNFSQWDILGKAVYVVNGRTRADPGDLQRDTYAKEVTYLRNWIEGRLQWLDSQTPSPPDFNQNGGPVPVGFALQMSPGTGYQAFPGVVHYTLDGSDPADAGAPANIFTSPLSLNERTHVRARTKNISNGSWSTLREATFLVGAQPADRTGLVISEIHYNPDGPDDLEFIELTNRSTAIINLTGVQLANAVEFTFGALDLMPGKSVLIVENQAVFQALFASPESAEYVEGIVIAGQWTGRLNNIGETISLLNPLGEILHEVTYSSSINWPSEADGKGFSLELRNLALDPSIASNWRLSSFSNGTPGTSLQSASITIAEWLDLHFTATEQLQAELGGLFADPDHDGSNNLLEFGFGTSPRETNNTAPIESKIELIEVNGITRAYQTLTFTRVTNSPLQFALQESSDLANWNTRPLIRVRATPNPGLQTEILTVRENQAVFANSLEGRKFLRIRVAE